MKDSTQELGLTIEYIRHSGFKVKTNDSLLIFDYYQGAVQLDPEKKIYIFSSHAHADHFNPEIFQWQKDYPHIQYILSSDIKGNSQLPQKAKNISFLAPYEEIRLDDLKIKAFGSTDVGISFLLELATPDGLRLFHAGDLNWWHWWGEPQEDIKLAEKIFKEEIAKIKGESIDIAFFPVDPRLEHYYAIGAEYFIQEIKPQILVPMHFWDKYNTTKNFAEKMAGSSTRILDITQANQCFSL